MEVCGSDCAHVGTVGGNHHVIPIDWIKSADDKVRQSANDAMAQ